MGEREKYGGPQVHSEFQMTLLIFKHTPNFETLLQFRRHQSEFENSTPNSKTSLRIRQHYSEFEKIKEEREFSFSPFPLSFLRLMPWGTI